MITALKSHSKLRAAIGLRAAFGKLLLHQNSSLCTVTFGKKVLTLAKSPALKCVATVNKFLVRHKKFGPAQNILEPVKGQGNRRTRHKKPFKDLHFSFHIQTTWLR